MTFHLPALLLIGTLAMTIALFFSRTEQTRTRLVKSITGCLVVWALYAASICWYFRDGLGPDAIESTGWLAFTRLFQSMIPVLLTICGITGLAYLGLIVSTKRMRKEQP